MLRPRASAFVLAASLLAGAVPRVASADDLSVIPVITSDHHFRTKWNNTVSSEGVRVTRANRAYPGEVVHLLVFFARYQTAPDGACDVTFDFTRTNAAGKVETDARGLLAMQGERGSPMNVYLARTHVEIVNEAHDPLGENTIKVTLHDNISGESATAETTYSLVEYGTDRNPMTFEETMTLFGTYHQTPRPHQFFEFFRMIHEFPDASRKAEIAMLLAPFMTALFEDNPYHKPHFPGYWLALSAEERRALLPIIKMITKDNENMLDILELTPDERERLPNIELPDFEDENIEQPGELDMLWSSFFATGEIEPIRQIAEATILARDGETDLEKTIGRAAIWSLRSNCEQHELVRAYCAYLAERVESLDPFVRVGLRKSVKHSAPAEDRPPPPTVP